MFSVRNTKLALAGIIVAFAFAAVYISLAIVDRQDALREVSRYNVAWAASQAVNEALRLEQRVAVFGLGKGSVDKDEVRLRFDILQNRLRLLQDGEVVAFTDRHPESRTVVLELAAALADLDPMIEVIDRPGGVERVLKRLAPLEGRLGRLAAAANHFGGEQVAEDQQQLLALHWRFSALSAGLILCGLALMGVLFWQNHLIGRAHQELRIMANDLHAAKDSAEAASEAKSRFLANMSHELRTPLNAIIGFSEIISQEAMGPVGQPRYREYAGDILSSGRHMLDLISDILTMAKLEAGPYELNQEVLDLKRLTQASVTMMSGAEMAKGREIIIEEAGDWPRLQADRRALRQMQLNILSNALKFSPRNTSVRISARLAGNGELWLTIADQGIGMTKLDALRAVQPFHQVDDGLARKYEGTGLGLSIVKSLIEHHGGRLVIESQPGRGTEVSLVFPAQAVAREPESLAVA